jgi:hypothetical protein
MATAGSKPALLIAFVIALVAVSPDVPTPLGAEPNGVRRAAIKAISLANVEAGHPVALIIFASGRATLAMEDPRPDRRSVHDAGLSQICFLLC